MSTVNVMVMNTRLTDLTAINNATKSSELAAYPASNAYDINRRTKTWRTAGCFEIVSGENTLVFREQVGVDLTATITAGTYATDALFRAAVKAALEAAGVATYTVSRDATTNRLEITSALDGGATVFQLMLTDSDSADMAAILGFSTAADLTGAAAYEADVTVIHTGEWMKWDFGGPVNPTCFAAFLDRNIPLNISPTATIKLQASHTDAWDTPAEQFTITYKDWILAHTNADGIAQSSADGYRFWRLLIIDQANPDGYLDLGVVFLGTHIELTRGAPSFPFSAPNLNLSTVVYSVGGQAQVGKAPGSQTFGLFWERLDNASAESLQDFYDDVGLQKSFMVVFDPGTVITTDSKRWIRVCKFEKEPVPEEIRPGNWQCRWNLREQL